jgi:putative two-component system response regulator
LVSLGIINFIRAEGLVPKIPPLGREPEIRVPPHGYWLSRMKDLRKKIVVVDDMVTNLKIGARILSDEYDVFTVPSGEKLFQLLGKVTPDLILMDVDMPVMNGYEALTILKKDEHARRIPVIFLSANHGPSYEMEGLSRGAADYIVKPCSPQLLRRRIETQIRLEFQQKKLHEYEEKIRRLEDRNEF